MPLAQAGSGFGDTVDIDVWNYGSSSTTIESNVNSCAFRGRNTYPGGSAVDGWASASSGETIGVYGLSDSGNYGKGVKGKASASTGTTYGVYGESSSIYGVGVCGTVTTTGSGIGVYGLSNQYKGIGVCGISFLGVWGESQVSDGIGVMGRAFHPNSKAIVAQGYPGNTANLQEWQATSGTPLSCVHANGSIATTNVFGFLNVQQNGSPYGVYMSAPADQCLGLHTNLSERVRIDSNGNVGIGTKVPDTPLHVGSSSSNPAIKIINQNNFVGQFIYCYSDTTSHIPFFSGRKARGTIASPTAVQTDDTLMRYGGSGYGSTGFPGGNRAILEFKASETWTDGAQGTYITFSTTPTGSNVASERMRITAAGEIIPPTDNTGSIGTASKRWNLVRATTVTSGDLAFENSFTVTEDEKVGLAFKNDAGEKIAVLDREGNFHIKGKFMEDLN